MKGPLLPCIALAALGVVAGVAPLPASAGPPAIAARAIYVVRPDPRLCPSPLCGGYWVALANHAGTRCSDGLLRPRCYVARALDAQTRQPTAIAGGTLAQAVLGSEEFGGSGKLGILTVTESWDQVGPAPPTGAFYRLRDTGIRCLRAPCFSIRLGRLNTGAHTTLVSALDLGPARSGSLRLRADTALESADGLLAAGRVTRTPGGGRAFEATQVYLRG